jgi:hypothetical protein
MRVVATTRTNEVSGVRGTPIDIRIREANLQVRPADANHGLVNGIFIVLFGVNTSCLLEKSRSVLKDENFR